jgi:hypothetical protein
MYKIVYNPFGFLIIVLSVIWVLVYCSIPNEKPKPTPTPIIHNQIPIGYNLGKVGKDSVLTIKGQFVRQVGDRVMIKVK